VKFVSAFVAAALLSAPLVAQGADLTIWWAKGYYPEQDEGVRRVIEDFQKDTGTSVELAFYSEPLSGRSRQVSIRSC
jgi:hypothetical protein